MGLETFTYYFNGTKKQIKVKICKSFWSKFSGLMFRRNSPPLLFIFKKEKRLSIHSFFCKPFRAFWLDKNKYVTKFIDGKTWRINYSGFGKYLLEIPEKLISSEK